MKKLLIIATLIWALPVFAFADEFTRIDGEGTVDSPYKVKKTSNPIEIDGIVNEEEWEDALLFTLDYEVDPGENIPAPIETHFYISYDEDNLYIAFRCYDPDPEAIRARFRDRDSLWSDDRVGITIDTFNDSRRAYDIAVNPYGVQSDGIIDEATGDYDDEWNAIWSSAGRITEFGWETEFAIPFSQLRIQQVDGPQVWGIDAFREYPRSVRHKMGLFPRERGNNSYLSQTRKIVGFAGLEQGKNLQIVPTITAGRIDEREDFPHGELKEIDSTLDAGITTKWGVTPNISILGTINPDFSQVEADEVQLDINRRFTLYFDETRPFFLEGKNYFETQELNLLHTRNIVDPDYAVKVTGKEGPHTFGVFTARDKFTSLIIPGVESSDSDSFDVESDATVIRYLYDFGANSSIGSMITHRAGGDYSNTVMSVDGSLRFTDSFRLNTTAAYSQSDYSQAMVDTFELEEAEIDGTAVSMEMQYQTANYALEADYKEITGAFRADLGFMTRVDYRSYGGWARYRWYGDSGSWFSRIDTRLRYSGSETLDGDLLDTNLNGSISYHGPMQSMLNMNFGKRRQAYETIEYDQTYYRLHGGFRPNSAIFINAHLSNSDAIDYTHNRAGNRDSYSLHMNMNLGDHMMISSSASFGFFNIEEEELYNTFVQESTISYQFNRQARLRAILQFARIQRNQALYADEVDPESTDFFSQLLFSYKINPQTVLYLGYDDSFVGDHEIDLTRYRRGVFVKLGYAWLQ